MAKYERKHTINDETFSLFSKITIMQYTNITIIVLLINMNLLSGVKMPDVIPILQGSFTDFTPGWYQEVGMIFCTTLLL